jgi:hypothetical protein
MKKKKEKHVFLVFYDVWFIFKKQYTNKKTQSYLITIHSQTHSSQDVLKSQYQKHDLNITHAEGEFIGSLLPLCAKHWRIRDWQFWKKTKCIDFDEKLANLRSDSTMHFHLEMTWVMGVCLLFRNKILESYRYFRDKFISELTVIIISVN